MNGDLGKEFFKVLQTSVDNTMDMLSMLQEQNEKFFNLITEHSLTTQTQGKKVLNEWLKKGKEAQETYRKILEENLRKVFQVDAKTK